MHKNTTKCKQNMKQWEVEVCLPPPPRAAMAELGWSGRCSVGGVRWHGASAGAEEESEGERSGSGD
jgi:hypothetical protein